MTNLLLVSALGAGNFQSFTVADSYVVAEEMAKCYMVSAVQPELHAFEFLKDLSQPVGILVVLFFLSRHRHLLKNKKPPWTNPERLLVDVRFEFKGKRVVFVLQ